MNFAKIACFVALLPLALPLSNAHAAPDSPTAKAAARLKKNPPTAWLAHYLPDDRYKIAGGVWKYVTTNLDTYYHRPDSPNMMRQPAAGVIGFPSAQAAEEAGYKPDPSDGTAQMVQKQRYQDADAAVVARAQAQGVRPGTLRKVGPVILADGASTMTIPQGWQRLLSNMNRDGKSDFSIDLIGHQGTGSMALFMTMRFPNINVGSELSNPKKIALNLRQFGQAVSSSGQVSNSGGSRLGEWANNSRVRATRWGGLPGVALSPLPGAGQGAGNLIMVGRGTKLYLFQMIGKGATAPNARQMIKSFRPR